MRCDTKLIIAATLRELMQERPVQKITIQDIMNRAGMKRQSFYYHFEDIYDVLRWETDRILFARLPARNGDGGEEWFSKLLTFADAEAGFLRRTIQAFGHARSAARVGRYIRPRVSQMMLGRAVPDRELTDEERIALDFAAYALSNYLIDAILGREPLNSERGRKRFMVSCHTAAAFRPLRSTELEKLA